MVNYWVWIGLFLLSAVFLFAVQIPIRRIHRVWVQILSFGIKCILFCALGYAMIVGNGWLLWHVPLLMGGMHCALLGDLIADLVRSILWLFRRRHTTHFHHALLLTGILGLVFGSGVLLYGTYNMQHVQVTERSFASSKLENEYRFAFISDTHVGTAQEFKVFTKAMEKTVNQKPDFVILGGDLTDEFTTFDEMKQTYQTIHDTLIAAKIPTYLVYGNHDRQGLGDVYANGKNFSESELESAILESGIQILQDKYVSIGDDLVLLGREDASMLTRRPVSEVIQENPNKNCFLLVADHQPYEYKDIRRMGMDLQVSGHSHAGQFFPMQLIYNLAHFDAYGEFQEGDTALFITSGEAGWGSPLRTEEHCEIMLVTLHP